MARDSAAAARRDAGPNSGSAAAAASTPHWDSAAVQALPESTAAASDAPSWPAGEEGCVLLRPRLSAGMLASSAGGTVAAVPAAVSAGGGSSSTGHSLSMRALGEAARSIGSGSMGRRSSEEAGCVPRAARGATSVKCWLTLAVRMYTVSHACAKQPDAL